MFTIQLGDQTFRSLKYLREDYVPDAVLKAFLDGSLEEWLTTLYYEKEAGEVRALPKVPSLYIQGELCRILGVEEYPDSLMKTYLERRDDLRTFTRDEKILSAAFSAAFNQAELAELLASGCTTIILCMGPFRIPVGKTGITYIGVGEPALDSPLRLEEYQLADIRFENISSMAPPLEGTIEEPGDLNPLAAACSSLLRSPRIVESCLLDGKDEAEKVECECFNTGKKALDAARSVLEPCLHQACGQLDPSQDGSVADRLARDYGAYLVQRVGQLTERLRQRAEGNPALEGPAYDLYQLVHQGTGSLRDAFIHTIGNREQVIPEIEECMKSVKLERLGLDDDEPSLFSRIIDRMLTTYVVDQVSIVHEAVRLTAADQARSIATEAWSQYEKYRRRIVSAAQAAGNLLTSEDFLALGLNP